MGLQLSGSCENRTLERDLERMGNRNQGIRALKIQVECHGLIKSPNDVLCIFSTSCLPPSQLSHVRGNSLILFRSFTHIHSPLPLSVNEYHAVAAH